MNKAHDKATDAVKKAKDAINSIGCRLFSIPPRSPDLNPIENIFHLIGKQLKYDALDSKLKCESYEKFVKRVETTCLEYSSVIKDFKGK